MTVRKSQKLTRGLKKTCSIFSNLSIDGLKILKQNIDGLVSTEVLSKIVLRNLKMWIFEALELGVTLKILLKKTKLKTVW